MKLIKLESGLHDAVVFKEFLTELRFSLVIYLFVCQSVSCLYQRATSRYLDIYGTIT